jgi:glycosyltransferase involved in cell wall biosynthesis
MKSEPTVATVVIYPEEGTTHSPVSALAGYSHSLLGHLPPRERGRHIVLTNWKSDAGPRSYEERGMQVRECWRKGAFLYWRQILSALRREKGLRVVHLQHEFNQFGGFLSIPFIPIWLWVARVFLRLKVVITYHEVLSRSLMTRSFLRTICVPVPPLVAKLALSAYYWIVSTTAHRIIVQDEQFAAILRKEYVVRTRIEVVRIGVEPRVLSLSAREAKKSLDLPESKPVLLFFGTIDWRKGLDLLLDAMQLVEPDACALVIAGGPPFRIKDKPEFTAWFDAIGRRARALPHVILRGYVDDELVDAYFAGADLVVLPYIIPQRVSAVLNSSISLGLPFLCCRNFAAAVGELPQFDPSPAALADKIRWALAGNLDLLRSHTKTLQAADTWTTSAERVARIYTEFSGPPAAAADAPIS